MPNINDQSGDQKEKNFLMHVVMFAVSLLFELGLLLTWISNLKATRHSENSEKKPSAYYKWQSLFEWKISIE